MSKTKDGAVVKRRLSTKRLKKWRKQMNSEAGDEEGESEEQGALVTAPMLPGMVSNGMHTAAETAAQLQNQNPMENMNNFDWNEAQTAQVDNTRAMARSQHDRSRMLPLSERPPQHNDTRYHRAQYAYLYNQVLPGITPPITHPTDTNFDLRSGFTSRHNTTTPITYPLMITTTNQTSHHRSSGSGFTSSGTLPAAAYSSAFVPNGNNAFFPSLSPAYGYGPTPVQPDGQVYVPLPQMMWQPQPDPNGRQIE